MEPFDYTAKEWIDHFRYFCEASLDSEKRKIGSKALCAAYFAAQYADEKEAAYKRQRFEKAMRFHEKHAKEFDFGKASVNSDEQRLVGAPVILGLWRVFSAMPDDWPESDIPVSAVVDVVKEIEETM